MHLYHPRMRVGNVFCLSVCLSIQAITFEPFHIETSLLLCRYVFTISGSSLNVKVIELGSRQFYLFQHANPLYISTGH